MTEDEMLPYAPVLERVVDLVTADSSMHFGTALEQAIQDLKIEVPDAVQQAILIAAFKVSVQGFPTRVES